MAFANFVFHIRPTMIIHKPPSVIPALSSFMIKPVTALKGAF
jgi:hypothetical protein